MKENGTIKAEDLNLVLSNIKFIQILKPCFVGSYKTIVKSVNKKKKVRSYTKIIMLFGR